MFVNNLFRLLGLFSLVKCATGTETTTENKEIWMLDSDPCEFGYKKNDDFTACIPDCPFDCGPGKCVAPNYCECDVGYEQIDEPDFDGSLCTPICKNCLGNCIKPYTCECDAEFKTRNESVDGRDCDCFHNCSITSRLCERTICLSKTTVYPESTGSYINDGLMNSIRSQKQKEIKSPFIWIYVLIGMFLLLILFMTLILIVKRQEMTYFFSRGSFVLRDDYEDSSSVYSMDMEILSTKNNRSNAA